MGKNRIRESLIKNIVNVVVHEIIAKHTNKPESLHFLNSEIIEYVSQTKKMTNKYNWDKEDKEYIEENALQMIEEKLLTKYSDVICSEQEIIKKLKDLINEMI